MIILGFGARARNGKDTAGEAIRDWYDGQNKLLRQHGLNNGTKVSIVKFAGAVYQEAREQYGMKEKDPILLQNIGMARREQDPQYWIKRAFASVSADTNIAIFTDVRFKNEVESIKNKGGYLVEVVRLNADGTRYYAADRPKEHPSETDLDEYNWDYRLTAKTGDAVLLGQFAITLSEYLRGLHD